MGFKDTQWTEGPENHPVPDHVKVEIRGNKFRVEDTRPLEEVNPTLARWYEDLAEELEGWEPLGEPLEKQ